MRNPACVLVPVIALVGISTVQARPPELPTADYPVVESCTYPDDEAARAAWKPMSGTADVSLVQVNGRKVLRMPCNLGGTQIDRASWDRAVELDLTACRGIQFRFFCADISPVSRFSVFLKSGEGWYATSFTPTTKTAWNTVALGKSKISIDTGTRGEPAGFGQIDTIRISAWRGQDKDTEFYIADIGLLGADAEIVVVSADSVARKSPRKARSIRKFLGTLTRFLDELGIPYTVISDLDLTAERLGGMKVAMLTLDHRLPETAEAELTKFMDAGGKAILFFGTPAKLRPLIGIKRGAYTPQKYSGYFSSIHFPPGSLSGAPRSVGQNSWGIGEAMPVAGESRVIGWWHDVNGKPTGHAAVVASDNCIQMTHVLLSDDPKNKRRMLLAFLGRFMPKLWKKAAESSIARISDIAGYPSFQRACREIGKWAGRGKQEILAQLDSARNLRQKAMALSEAGEYPKAIDIAGKARTALLNAYCSAQTSLPGEFRAFWTHEMLGIPGWGWDKSIKVLAENGFTAIIPNLARAGTAYYQSDVLPVAPQVQEQGDQIAKCLAACRKYGLEIHVWKVNYNTAGWAPKEFLERMEKEGRMQVSSKGVPSRWLCPSHPANQKLEIDSMLEIMTKYDVDGIHFDYIRYPDGDHCFCQGCRKRLEKAYGVRAGSWPADALKRGQLREKWLQFRRGSITKVVAAVSERAREIKPDIKISAAVFRNWTSARDGNGQDWKLWCDRGYLDFVCPMDYTASDVEFENIIPKQIKWAGKVPCYPGIGLLKFGARADRAISQIKITRRYKTGGFVIWQYALSQRSDTLVPLLGRGITAK